MDEKQIRAAFEEKYGTRPVAKGSFGMQMAALEDAAEWDSRLEGWLSCYQHLEPQLKDAERYQWLRSDDIEVMPGQREINVYMERLPHTEEPTVLLVESALDEAIDAALDLQKEKQQ